MAKIKHRITKEKTKSGAYSTIENQFKTNCTVDSTFNLNIRYSISFRRFQIVVFNPT